MSVKDVLESFALHIRQEAVKKLSKSGKSDTGNLANSIQYKLKTGESEYKLTITADEYGAYADKGVRGKTSASLAPDSPFRFGSGKGKKGGLTEGIGMWVRRKRIQFKDSKTGKFLSYESTAWLITRSVYNKGLPATGFLTQTMKDEFIKLPQKLLDAYMPEVMEKLKTAIRNEH